MGSFVWHLPIYTLEEYNLLPRFPKPKSVTKNNYKMVK